MMSLREVGLSRDMIIVAACRSATETVLNFMIKERCGY